jgi:hypothetical protein
MNQEVDFSIEMFVVGEVTFVQGNDGIATGGALAFQRVTGGAPGPQKIRWPPTGSADNPGSGFARVESPKTWRSLDPARPAPVRPWRGA